MARNVSNELLAAANSTRNSCVAVNSELLREAAKRLKALYKERNLARAQLAGARQVLTSAQRAKLAGVVDAVAELAAQVESITDELGV